MRDELTAKPLEPPTRRVQRLDEPKPFEVVMGYLPGADATAGNGATPDPFPSPTAIAFVLWPRTWGAGSDAVVVVPADTDVVTFDIRLESHEFSRYAITVKELITNQIVWRTNRVTVKSTADHASVIAVIPAKLLQPRHYTVDLTGCNPEGGLELISRCPFELLAR